MVLVCDGRQVIARRFRLVEIRLQIAAADAVRIAVCPNVKLWPRGANGGENEGWDEDDSAEERPVINAHVCFFFIIIFIW